MRKGIFAMEEMAEDTPVVQGDMESKVGDMSDSLADIDTRSEEVNEADAILTTVDAMAEQVEASPEGISEETAKVLNTAVEHFCNRLSYKKKVVPAMEGFSADSRKRTTEMALENMKELSTRLEKNIQIAQEGIVDSLRKSIEMMFTTAESVIKKLAAVSAEFDKNGAKEGTIENPAWGKYLFGGSDTYTGADAVAALAKINKVLKDDSAVASVKTLTEAVKNLTKEVRGNWFVSNEEDIARIEALAKAISSMREGLMELVGENTNTTATVFSPISAAEKKKLVASIEDILINNNLQKELDAFSNEKGVFIKWAAYQRNFRLKMDWAEDVKKAKSATAAATEIVKNLSAAISSRIKVCSAAVSYIEASTAK